MNNAMVVWTGDDYENHLCRADQIGTPKQIAEPEAVNDVLNALPAATLAEFKQAVLRVARDKHGTYDEFLRQNPGFHQKFLLAMAREQQAPGPAKVDINISWLTPERLSYKNPETHLELVQEVKEPKPWREGNPESGRNANAALDDLLYPKP